MNKELEDALRYDPLADAEKITGKSYKDNDSVAWLGMDLMHRHADKKDALLYLNNDTCNSKTLQENLDAIEGMGFALLASGDIPNTNDRWRIFWRSGVLIFCDSYSGDTTLNSGKAYFNYSGSYEGLFGCSNGPISDETRYGDVDVREGLKHRLDTLSENGTLLDKWLSRGFLWLLHYGDSKAEGYDRDAINAERIAMLPPEVQDAITPEI